MLFYNKSVKLQSGSTSKLSYTNFSTINSVTDENILPLRYAKIAYNFINENGALKTGYGFELLSLPYAKDDPDTRAVYLPVGSANPHKIWCFKYYDNSLYVKDYKIVVLDKDGCLYIIDLYSSNSYMKKIDNVTLSTDSVAVNFNLNGEDVLIISSPDGSMGYINGASEYVSCETTENQPDILDMAIHYERLFAVGVKQPRRLYFSDDLDPTNWNISLDDAGFIDFSDERGDLKRVFSFNNYLYVLREYGISKVSAFGDQEQFYTSHCYTANTKIYEKTACLCGDVLIFLARDGLYSFDGININKISINIDNMFGDNTHANSCFYNGKYYLACKINYNDNETMGCEGVIPYYNNTMLCLDIQTGNMCLTRGIDLKQMLPLEEGNLSEMLCLYDSNKSYVLGKLNKLGKFFGESTLKKWYSPLTDLGYGNKRKLVKEIYLRTKYDCYIYVKTESSSKRIKVYGSAGVTRVPVNVIGTLIAIDFESEIGNAEISNPQIIIDLLGAL